jgi:hypothetical protein
VTALLGSGAFTVATAAEAHSGSIPLSGPVTADGDQMDMGGPQTSAELAALLADTDTKWAAATTGGTQAANLALASGRSVIGIGGWNGGDPAPTLAEFQQYVEDGEISYYVSGGMGGGPGGNNDIAQWVADNFESRSIDGQTVYDLRG